MGFCRRELAVLTGLDQVSGFMNLYVFRWTRRNRIRLDTTEESEAVG